MENSIGSNGTIYHRSADDFVARIERMNRIMKISCPDQLTDLGRERVSQFNGILLDEISEIDSVTSRLPRQMSQQDMVELSDWLGDLVVYVMSEARRWGIPILQVLHAIMDSQDSKLDENGQPIHDPATGKFLKGPNYKPPEEAIMNILFYGSSAAEDDGPRWNTPEESVEMDKRDLDIYARQNASGHLCPHCKTPINDEMMRQLIMGVYSEYRTTGGCPSCDCKFSLESIKPIILVGN